MTLNFAHRNEYNISTGESKFICDMHTQIQYELMRVISTYIVYSIDLMRGQTTSIVLEQSSK